MKTFARELETIVEDVYTMLETMAGDSAATRPGTDQWSPKEIVGHLIDSAANNHQRFVRLMESGELTFPPYAQQNWVQRQAYQDADWTVLLSLWRAYNLHLAHVIRQIPEERLSSLCALGTSEPVTLCFLVEDYLSHLKLHVAQLGL
jgi:hypothetical protein